jgi:uncharacterized membrane protein YkoI
MNRFCIPFLVLAIALPVLAELSRDDAAEQAARLTGGRVLSVERVERDGRIVWRVKVVTRQGEVKILFLDAQTGRPH